MVSNKSSLDERISIAKFTPRKLSVKVPKLKIRRKKTAQKKEASIPTSSIINILIKSAIEKAKRERKEKQQDSSYKIIKQERQLIFDGGYGTVSKGYGTSPHTSYVDYEKLFSYLGKFKSKNPYENISDIGESSKAESGSFVLADKESMDKVGRFDKYFKSPAMAIQTMALSLVPVAGLSSTEWEEIKMMMRFDPILYALKSKIS